VLQSTVTASKAIPSNCWILDTITIQIATLQIIISVVCSMNAVETETLDLENVEPEARLFKSNFYPSITVRKSNHKIGPHLSLQAIIKVSICRKKFEWSVSIDKGILDVTPIWASFANTNFSCYEVTDKILNIMPDDSGSYNLSAVADILISDFLCQQKENVIAMHSQTSAKTEFTLGLLEDMTNVTMISWTDNEIMKILCEFPIFSSNDAPDPSSAYLYDTTDGDPICMSLILSVSKSTSAPYYEVIFPQSMPCSRNIDFPNNLPGCSGEDFNLIDLMPYIENKILSSLTYRKSFVEELQRLAAVLEYDAIDFSFCMIALRMKHNNMYTICTVEFRLTHSFPATIPLLSLHDLQNAFSAPIDTSPLKLSKSWSPERIARELLLLISEVISLQAFGSN
jgi:hypothetical protein